MPKRKWSPCIRYCEGRLHGIVENLKIRGEIEENSQFDFRPVRGLTYVPKGCYVLRCEHDREWLVKDITDVTV